MQGTLGDRRSYCDGLLHSQEQHLQGIKRALASEAADLMVQKNIGHLPVVQGEKVIGIVTRTDVINYLYGMLPS
ncbi:MAG: CBS domain-containing protein [Geobacteraceae bacterium]|nr:CBS domain-containing protein [Geobacteraceae bacterium]